MSKIASKPPRSVAPSVQHKGLSYFDVRAAVLMFLALVYVMWAGLLPALLAGLLVFSLTEMLADRLPGKDGTRSRNRKVAAALLALLIIAAITAGVTAMVVALRAGPAGISAMMQKMAQILETTRQVLPASWGKFIPVDTDWARTSAVDWLRQHAGELQHYGAVLGRVLVHVFMGMIIGALIAIGRTGQAIIHPPFAAAVQLRVERLALAFRQVVFAQIQISAINTAITALYLLLILPMFGVNLPAVKTLVAVTFVAGLLPVVGNLISNSVIVVASLNHSPLLAATSLIFLVVIHKLEYFLNARIIGGRVQARAWELLIAMLAMEAIFGIPGLIAAPIFYTYLKREAQGAGWV